MTLALQLTLSRIALTPVICGCIIWDTPGSFVVALVLFALAAITDYLDGYVARLTHTPSDLGALLDPLADKLLVIATLFALVSVGRLGTINFFPALIIVSREVFILGLRDYMARGAQSLAVIDLAKWKTACQMLSLAGFLCPMTPLSWRGATLCLWGAAVLSAVTAMMYGKKAYQRSSENF